MLYKKVAKHAALYAEDSAASGRPYPASGEVAAFPDLAPKEPAHNGTAALPDLCDLRQMPHAEGLSPGSLDYTTACWLQLYAHRIVWRKTTRAGHSTNVNIIRAPPNRSIRSELFLLLHRRLFII